MVPAGSRRVTRAPRYSGIRLVIDSVRVNGCHVLRRGFPDPFRSAAVRRIGGPTTPDVPKHGGFGLLPSRSPLLGESFLFSFPAGTKMFQFPAFASPARAGDTAHARWVVPFGDHRIKGYLRLPGAFRSLSRPSSPPRAKASTMCPSLPNEIPYTPRQGGKAYLMLVSFLGFEFSNMS